VNTLRPKKKGRPQSKYSVLAVLPLGPHKSPKAKSFGFVKSVSALATWKVTELLAPLIPRLVAVRFRVCGGQ
jgi:hypothetical protein